MNININWKVRLVNKDFWVTMIPAILVLVQHVAAVFGFTLDLGELGNKLLEIVNTVFVMISAMGIVVDPTTKGVSDSERAMTYEKPN